MTLHHLSASSIRSYSECPHAFWLERVVGVPRRPSLAMVMGRVVHHAIEAFHKDDDPYHGLSHHWKYGRELLKEAEITPPAEAFGQMLTLLDLYLADPQPAGMPERMFRVQVDGIGVPLLGFLDLDHDYGFTEFKTSGWAWKAGRVEQELQGALYAAAWRIERGHLPPLIDYVILSSNPRPRLTRLPLVATDQMADEALAVARGAWNAIQREEWEPRCPKGKCRYPGQCVRDPEGLEGQQEVKENAATPRLVFGGTHA